MFKFYSDSQGAEPASNAESPPGGAPSAPQATVIPGADSLIGDLLDMDLGGPTPFQQQQLYQQMPQSQPVQSGVIDFLGGEGLDQLVRAGNLSSVCCCFCCCYCCVFVWV